jgi:hypothetical protein
MLSCVVRFVRLSLSQARPLPPSFAEDGALQQLVMLCH